MAGIPGNFFWVIGVSAGITITRTCPKNPEDSEDIRDISQSLACVASC